jgi:hypothetical protein
MIDLSQEEIKILVAVLDSVNFKLADAPKVVPLREKLFAAIVPDKPVVKDAEIVK